MYRRWALSLAFFLSGAAGLIFQVVWFYRASLVFGNGVWAVTLVLSSFMAGLAVGSVLATRMSRSLARPLLAYAALEAVVAVSGFIATGVMPAFAALATSLGAALGDGPVPINMVRLCAAFAILVVPATAMGATLPIVVGAMSPLMNDDPTAVLSASGRALGRLYGWNTLGAVAGVVTAEVVLIAWVGVRGSAGVAALLDLLAGAIALQLSRGADRMLTASRRAAAGTLPTRSTPTPVAGREIGSLLVCAGLAGGCLLALEVLWFRFLSMYVLSTTLAMSLMLAVVLTAIGLGALAASAWLARRRDAADHLTAIALAAGCAVVLSYTGFQFLTSGTQAGEWYRVLWFAAALAFPTCFLSGVLFTLTGEALQRRLDTPVRSTAYLTLANTLGALAGPPVSAFLLLPWLGMERSFFLMAAAYAVAALLAANAWQRNSRHLPSRVAAVLLAGILVTFPFGLMQRRYFPRAAQTYAADGSEIVATREGPSETIFLMQQQWHGRPVYDRLVTNGFSMSGTAVPGMRYMRYFAYWPMLFHTGPIRRALVICYGVGVTAGAVTDIPSVQSIDIAEISRDVIAMSDVIYAGGGHPLRDPRVRLHVEDGRYLLQTSDQRFDLITGEPPPPRTPGTSNIYTREYFQLIYDHLAEGGISTYWVPVARPNPGTDVDTIIRAFCDVFTDCSLWNGTPFDLMLAGSRHAIQPLSAEAFDQPWRSAGVADKLRQVGFEEPEQIGATFLGDAAYLNRLTAQTPPLTDDFPQRLRPTAGRASLSDPRYGRDAGIAERYQGVVDVSRAKTAFAGSAWVRQRWPQALVDRTLPRFDDQAIINRVFWEGGQPLRQIEDLHGVLAGTRLTTLPLWILGTDDVKGAIAGLAAAEGGDISYARALSALAARDFIRAAALFGDAEARGLTGATVRSLRVYALCAARDIEGARSLSRGLQPHGPDEVHFWSWMGKQFGVGPFGR